MARGEGRPASVWEDTMHHSSTGVSRALGASRCWQRPDTLATFR